MMVAYDGFLCVGGVELVSPQAAHYAAAGCAPGGASVSRCCPCEGLAQVLGYPDGWTTPEQDQAPWIDPTEPESTGFAGLIIQEISGLGPGRFTRQVTETAGVGAIISRGRQLAPQITVTGVLMGRSCCSVAYGLRWLRTALRGTCGPGCAGEDLTYLQCCPPPPDDTAEPDWQAHFQPHWRTLKRAALISDVEVIDRMGKSCGACGACPITRVQFTLAAGLPCAYREPVTVVEQQPLIEGEYIENCFTWIKLLGDQECPPDETTCTQDPACVLETDCPSPPGPPPMPVPTNPCINCTPFTQRKLCVDIPTDAVPTWTEGVISMQIYSGSLPLRHVRVLYYPNPLGRPVQELDPCTACAETNIALIPAFSTFDMDSLARQATITCPGSSPTSAASVLGGPPGKLFSYPTIACGGVPYTACVEVDADSLAEDAWITMQVTAQEC